MKAVFLDRDGVINKEVEYLHKAEDFEFIPGVFEGIKTAVSKGYMPVIITNQSGIGRGYYSEAEYQTLTLWMLEAFKKEGIVIAGVYHCPHGPEAGCACRKPKPGMIREAAKDLGIDLGASFLVGDKESDIQAAIAAGIPRHALVRSGHRIDESKTAATCVADSLSEAVDCLA